jgi:hypothetical protein
MPFKRTCRIIDLNLKVVVSCQGQGYLMFRQRQPTSGCNCNHCRQSVNWNPRIGTAGRPISGLPVILYRSARNQSWCWYGARDRKFCSTYIAAYSPRSGTSDKFTRQLQSNREHQVAAAHNSSNARRCDLDSGVRISVPAQNRAAGTVNCGCSMGHLQSAHLYGNDSRHDHRDHHCGNAR